MRRWLILAVVAMGLGHATAARASVEAAVQAEAQGRVADAAREYAAAYTADPSPEVALDAARAYDRADRCDRAVAYYQRYLDTRAGRDRLDGAPALAHCQAHRGARHGTRYAVPVAITDGIGLAALLAGAAAWQGPLAAVGGVLVIAGGPVIHLWKGNGGGAVLSLLARTFLPLLGGAIGGQATSCGTATGESCATGGFLLGAGIGGAAAMVIDWAVLARKRPGRDVTPLASVGTHGDVVVGLGGRW